MQDITTLLNEKKMKMLNVTFVGWYFNPGSSVFGQKWTGNESAASVQT